MSDSRKTITERMAMIESEMIAMRREIENVRHDYRVAIEDIKKEMSIQDAALNHKDAVLASMDTRLELQKMSIEQIKTDIKSFIESQKEAEIKAGIRNKAIITTMITALISSLAQIVLYLIKTHS